MDISSNDIKKIAILGKANSGKNTTAELLAKSICKPERRLQRPYRHNMVAFADPIKKMVTMMFPWSDRICLYGASSLRNRVIQNAFDKTGQPLTYRQALIDLGELGRSYDPDHWVKIYDHTIKAISEPDSNAWERDQPDVKLILCPDVRFQNEFDYLKSNNYFIIKIFRDTSPIINHASETNQDKIKDSAFDFVIDNNGPLQNLKDAVKQIVAKL